MIKSSKNILANVLFGPKSIFCNLLFAAIKSLCYPSFDLSSVFLFLCTKLKIVNIFYANGDIRNISHLRVTDYYWL